MAYVVTEACIKCKYTDCVDICPVDCFREGPNFLVIDPDECIDCTLCVAECPADAIFVESAENTDEKRFSPGDRYASTYEINMLRCIYCGFCEDACPTEAIVLGDNYELSFTDRRQAIYTKDLLLEPVSTVDMLTPRKVDAGLFTRSVPEMKDPRD